MKRSIWLILIYILNASIQFQGEEVRTVFGVRVSYQSDGSMITLVAYLANSHSLSYQKILSVKEFVFFASGEWPSSYNPNKINFFEENNVSGGVYYDSVTHQKIPYCFSLDSLWKLRFKSYPFKGKNEMGWSQDSYSPSLKQKRYLFDRYGIQQIDTKFFLDTSFWKLLRDVRDSTWIATYKNI